MRKWLRLGLCLGLLTVALTCSALAATDGYTTDEKGTVTYNGDGSYTASYSAATIAGNQYALLVVKGTPGNYSISADTIMYIDQVADENGVSFTFIPKSVPDCVVLLGGEFVQETSPVLLGTLIGQGVTVSGDVTLQGRTDYSGAAVTLTGSNGTYEAVTDSTGAYFVDGVAPGSYTLTISMSGYLSYTKTSLTVEDETVVPAKELLGGEIQVDGQVTILDLSKLLGEYGQVTTTGSDINGDGQVTILDLSILLGNYGEVAVTEA